jgi:transposase InsO family protein
LPAELQKRVHEEVEQAKQRSGWPVAKTLTALGVSVRSYYRWLRERAWDRPRPAVKSVPPYEATAAEKAIVLAYARKHPALRHRELAWRMTDDGVACLSPSTVYRILKAENLVCLWQRRSKRVRLEAEKASRPDERWATDLMYLQVGGVTYYWVGFLDEYSRYLVHWDLVSSMDGQSLARAAGAALATLPHSADGGLLVTPEIRSDNGSGYVSKEFRRVLRQHGLRHTRIKPHCPEENGLMERANRTLREQLDGEELVNPLQARDVLARVIRRYNEERLHSAIEYLRPIDYYRGKPEELRAERKRKLAEARHRRREANLALRQPTLPFSNVDGHNEPAG